MSEDVKLRSSIGVIGAGIQGVCTSLALIKKNFKVTLIDRDSPGKNSASYGNAGHFSPYASVPINRPDILVDIPSMLLNSFNHLAAVLGPTFETPGILSELSPTKAR